MQNHNQTVIHMATLMGIPNPETWDPLEAPEYVDDIYCKYYEGLDIGLFNNKTLIEDMH